MHRALARPVTAEMIDDYRRDGVVCLRQMLNPDWIARLQQAAQAVIDKPDAWNHTGPSHGGMVSIAYLWREPGAFREFALGSGVGELVGRVIGSERIQMYHDHLFHKPAGSGSIMRWHADHLWPFNGEMVTNLWIALTPVNEQNGRMEFIAGYHNYCREHTIRFSPLAPCPDFELMRENKDFPFRFVTWDLEPGDAVLFHFDTPHFSKGNGSSAAAGRTGLAVRTIGDDVTWRPSPEQIPVLGIDLDSVQEGARPEPGPLLPVIWSEAG